MINDKISKLENGDSYLNDSLAISRLLEEYEKFGNLIVGVDFDSTIFDLYETNLDVTKVINLILKCQDAGFTLCMWSAIPDSHSLTYKKRISKDIGINFQYFNESPVMNDSRKPHFNILLDDRAGLRSAHNILSMTLRELGH